MIVVFVEPLHGVTYALMWSASTSFAHSLAPPGYQASAQGLLAGVHWGLGQALGAIFGGLIYERYGAQTLFTSGACTAVFALLILSINIDWRKPALSKPAESSDEPLLPEAAEPTSDEGGTPGVEESRL